MADDMSFHDLGSVGNPDVHTPHLDQFARQGTTFTHAFNSSPMCAPTRMSLYTGLHPVRHGGHPNHSEVYPHVRSLPDYLRKLGYAVGLLGKRHEKPESQFAFENLGGRHHDNGKGADLDTAVVGEFMTANDDQPWCLVVTSNQPHTPWNRGDSSVYDAAALTLPPYLADTPTTREAMTKYYAEITYMDAQFGRVMQELENNGAAENTLVLFLTEQGSNFPFCKWTCYDSGLRATLIARWPGEVPVNTIRDTLIQYVDIVPTLIDLAGGESVAGDFDGRSLAKIFGSDEEPHHYVFGIQTTRGIHHGSEAYGIRTVRDQRYRLIWNLHHTDRFQNSVTRNFAPYLSWATASESGNDFAAQRHHDYAKRPEFELYDLDKDPWSLTNLATDPSQTDRIEKLLQELKAWMRQQSDSDDATERAALTRIPSQQKKLSHIRQPARRKFPNMAFIKFTRTHFRLLALCVGSIISLPLTADDRPNLVLILSDDMGWSDIQPYGGEIETPALQRLANNGLRFTQFYNNARCSQTRASLLTGLVSHQTGMGMLAETPTAPGPADADFGYHRYLNRNCVTIAEALKPAGYHTYMSGKWHLGYHEEDRWPRQRGFDRFYGIVAGASSYFRPAGPRGLTLDNSPLPEPTGDYYTTDAFTDYALEFIDTTPEDEPFFLYLAYNAPHWPLHAREEDIAKFVGRYRTGWDLLRATRWERQIAAGLVDPSWGLSQRDDGARAWSKLTPEQITKLDYFMAVYAAMVHRMDHNMGRLVDHLETKGELDNTLIVFLNDNGACAEPYNDLGGGTMASINDPRAEGSGPRKKIENGSAIGTGWANAGNTPFRRYKSRLYEGGISTPAIMHWLDGIKTSPGTITRAKGYVTDIMPTFLELADATYPSDHDGGEIKPLYSESLTPVFEGDTRDTHEWMFWEHYRDRAVRKGDWKILGKIGDDNWELYDLTTDRTESIDLADRHPKLVAEMAAAWESWAWSHDVLPNRRGTTK